MDEKGDPQSHCYHLYCSQVGWGEGRKGTWRAVEIGGARWRVERGVAAR